MTRRSSALAAVLAAWALPLCGCGSTPLSLTQLRSRATPICLRGNRRLQAIGAPQSVAGAKAFLDKGAATLTRELDQLRGLTGSGAVGQVYKAALSAVGSEVVAIRSTVHALSHGADTVPALRALSQRLTPLETQADNAWRALQIPACVTR